MHVYGERSSGSKDKDRGVPKNTFRVVTKNTFLTVEGIEGVEGGVGDGLKEKPNSAPASLSSSSGQSQISSDACSEPSASAMAYCSEPSASTEAYNGPEGAGKSNPSKKDASRSNKQHRIRYRKLAMKLEEQVKADPLGVDLASLNLPPFVESDSWLRDKLLRRLRSLREDTLAAAGSRSKNTSRAASSGPLKMSL
mmetsp:Transcript_49136/g.118090  ORF Transcript_49136/g.118090 Transcript_49136/m.118090 type:complete len:196 (+) Transcript_49136:54-641(+)